jgi:hypothetical protein
MATVAALAGNHYTIDSTGTWPYISFTSRQTVPSLIIACHNTFSQHKCSKLRSVCKPRQHRFQRRPCQDRERRQRMRRRIPQFLHTGLTLCCCTRPCFYLLGTFCSRALACCLKRAKSCLKAHRCRLWNTCKSETSNLNVLTYTKQPSNVPLRIVRDATPTLGIQA